MSSPRAGIILLISGPLFLTRWHGKQQLSKYFSDKWINKWMNHSFLKSKFRVFWWFFFFFFLMWGITQAKDAFLKIRNPLYRKPLGVSSSGNCSFVSWDRNRIGGAPRWEQSWFWIHFPPREILSKYKMRLAPLTLIPSTLSALTL